MRRNHLKNQGDLFLTKVRTYEPWALRRAEIVSGASLSITVFLFPAVVLLASLPARSQPDERILAQIGDKRISVKEFLERSELTVRPGVFKNKNISLNNLISEKILALEAEHNNNRLSPARSA